MLKGTNTAIINASHATFYKRYKTTARIYISQNNIPVNYSIPHSLKKSIQFELCTHVQNNIQITNKIKFLLPAAKYNGLHYKEWRVRSKIMKSMDRQILLVLFL